MLVLSKSAHSYVYDTFVHDNTGQWPYEHCRMHCTVYSSDVLYRVF